MAQRDLFIGWLNDAYAMEQSLIRTLENHAGDAKDFPQMEQRIRQHIEETRRHSEMVKSCLKQLGENPSAIKTGMANVMGTLQGASTGMAKDELVKNGLADYSTEHFEIASYRALIAAAEALGEVQITSVCRQILQEEEAMARWLEQQMPTIVSEMLSREMGLPPGAGMDTGTERTL